MTEERGAGKPQVELDDGNVFVIIGRVSKALKRAGQREKADEWVRRAAACHSYDDVLRIMFEYVEVE